MTDDWVLRNLCRDITVHQSAPKYASATASTFPGSHVIAQFLRSLRRIVSWGRVCGLADSSDGNLVIAETLKQP